MSDQAKKDKSVKRRHALMALAMVLTVLVLLLAFVAVILPPPGRMRELGVKSTAEHYGALRERLYSIEYEGFGSRPKDVMRLKAEGEGRINGSITNEELSAFLKYSPLFSPFVKRAEVACTEGGYLEFSALINVEKFLMFLPEESVSYLPGIAVSLAPLLGDLAFYGKISLDIDGGSVDKCELISLEIFGIDVMQISNLISSDISADLEFILNEYAADYGIYIDELKPEEGALRIDASLPEKISSN